VVLSNFLYVCLFVIEIDQIKHVDHIPGLSSAQVADLQTILHENDLRVLQLAMECIATVSKAQYLLFTSAYELEPQAIDSLNAIFPFPVYPIGPAVPFLELEDNSSARSHDKPSYLQWLDSQPAGSVLYISLGSFLSVSGAQMDEIAAGLRDSGVRFLWVARGESSSQLKERCGGMGIVLPWCEQLRVLCHSSIGGFWTHCGWNSTLEAVFAGVPMLTFPLFLDQVANSRLIVEEWRIGWRIKRSEAGNDDILVTKEEISELVRRFMNLESREVKELRERVRGLKDSCHQAIAEGGSSHTNLDAFIRGISGSRKASLFLPPVR
jgi:UDP:flavonoid glycosyltransferase YjiC (YdhE family)